MKTQQTKRCLVGLIVSIIALSGNTWADLGGPSFYDDFSDGDLQDGSPVNWWFCDVNYGECVITGEGLSIRPNPGGYPWAVVLDESGEGAVYSGNMTIRAQFKMDNPVGEAHAGIWFRLNDTGDYYLAGIYHKKLFLSYSASHAWQMFGGSKIIPGYDAAQHDIIIEVDVTDFTDSTGSRMSRLEVRGWMPGQDKPEYPQISIVDSKYEAGQTLLYAYQSPATFRWVEVIAEPTEPVVDFNGDGSVDIKDLLNMIQNWGQDEPSVDLNSDGTVDENDLEILMEYWDQNVDDPTLLAHWALDETEGTIAFDSAGTNDAVLSGDPIWQATMGQVGGALELDGTDDFIITESVLNPAEGPFSVLAWVKGGAAGQVIVSESTSNWLCIDTSTGGLITEIACQGRASIPLVSETVITDDEWHRIGLVWNGSQRQLYVDGIIVAEDMQKELAGSYNGLNIGCGKTMESGTFFSGLIDDVRIYNRAVSP